MDMKGYPILRQNHLFLWTFWITMITQSDQSINIGTVIMAVEGQGLGFRRSIGTVIMTIDQSINIGTVIMAQVRGGTVSGNVIDIALNFRQIQQMFGISSTCWCNAIAIENDTRVNDLPVQTGSFPWLC